MSRDKNCREAIFVHRGGKILKEEKMPFLWAKDSFGGILGDNLGEGNCESKIPERRKH